MNRPPVPVLAILLVLAVAATAPLATPASGAEPAITNVTVSPREPQTGDLVRFTTTLRNSEGADGSFEVTGVWIREAGTTNEYARVRDVGNVPPGSTLEVPLTARFREPGVYDLRVRVNVVDEDDELTQLQYPVTVVVSERGTQLSIDVDEPVEGERTSLNVTVSNGGSDPIRQLDLCLDGDGLSLRNPCRLAARLDASQDRSFTFDATFDGAGEQAVEATLEYTSSSGQTRQVRAEKRVAVESLREDVSVDATLGSGGGSTPPVLVEVTNFGNARLEDVSVRLADGDRVVARRAVEPVEAGASREVRVNVSGVGRADLDVSVGYETGGRAGEVVTTVAYAAQPARIQLTGVDYSVSEGVATISGSASNVGLSAANSVVVEVLPAAGVRPVGPNREYFVGTVPASDFVSFDLTARVSAGATDIPVRITYLSDGIERTETVTPSTTRPRPSRAPRTDRAPPASSRCSWVSWSCSRWGPSSTSGGGTAAVGEPWRARSRSSR